MSTTYKRLVGDTSRFAIQIAFSRDSGLPPFGPSDLEASWGSFQLWVEGRNLCKHQEIDDSVDAVHWYLLPLLEWFATNWEPLFHEERLPVDVAGASAWESLKNSQFPPAARLRNPAEASNWEQQWSSWWQRHALQACREGGIFPDIIFRRWRSQIEISWGPTRVAGQPEHFQFSHTHGLSRLSAMEVAAPLFEALKDGHEYVSRQVADSERLERLCTRLREIRDETPKSQRLMWIAGLGTDESSIVEGWNEVTDCVDELSEPGIDHLFEPVENHLVLEGSPTAALMFGTVSPEIGKADKLSLLEFVLSLTSSEETQLDRKATQRSLKQEQVWQQGYDLALEVLDVFDVIDAETVCLDVKELIEQLDINLEAKGLEDKKIRGVAIASNDHRPGILINEAHLSNRYPSGRRFTMAHELCHLLHDRAYGETLALVSGEWAPEDIEKRANAFAAMLLMPPVLVERALDELGGELSDGDDAIEMAKRLGTSTTALLRHLNNTDYLDDATYDGIQIELDEARTGS